jgi:hypothetical protein
MPNNGILQRSPWLLYSGIKALLKCDEAETVRGIADYTMSQYRILRSGSELMERRRNSALSEWAALAGAVFRYLEVKPPASDAVAVWAGRLENEKRVLARLPKIVPEVKWSSIGFRFLPARAGIGALLKVPLKDRRRIMRIARHLLRRGLPYFRVLRAIEMIGYYARYLSILRHSNIKLVAISSHSNPHAIALNIAARRCGIPIVLITHGMPVRPVAKLSYDAAQVHCKTARRTYVEEGTRLGRVFIHGRRQDFIRIPDMLPEKLTVGIFLCKDVDQDVFQTLTDKLLGHPRVTCVIVRPHPRNLWLDLKEWISKHRDGRLMLSSNNSGPDDIAKCDIVLGGNSSVLIEAVTAGRPSGYIKKIDHGSYDLHRFVESGLIFPVPDDLDIALDAMLGFYRQPSWKKVLKTFANIDEDAAAVNERLAEALVALAARPNSHDVIR